MELFQIQKLLTAFLTPLGGTILLVIAGVLLRRRWICTVAVLALWLASMPFAVQRLADALGAADHYDAVAAAPIADVIVVLGGTGSAGNGQRLFHNLGAAADRLLEATELFQAGKAPLLLFTGGPVDAWGDSEADGAARLWQRLGVPASAIVLERESRTTRENAALTLPLLQARKTRTVLLVTSAWHLPRALRNFRDAAEAEGLDITFLPYPCDPMEFIEDQDPWLRWLPNSQALEASQKLVKEALGLLWAKVGGR